MNIRKMNAIVGAFVAMTLYGVHSIIHFAADAWQTYQTHVNWISPLQETKAPAFDMLIGGNFQYATAVLDQQVMPFARPTSYDVFEIGMLIIVLIMTAMFITGAVSAVRHRRELIAI